jgi:Bacterial Ig domain/FG-GAP-like repeat/FG-GAP repeat
MHRLLVASPALLGVACGDDEPAMVADASSSDDASASSSSSSSSSSGEPSDGSSSSEASDGTSTGAATEASTSAATSSDDAPAAPLANDEVYRTRTDEPLERTALEGVLINDSDPSGGPLQVLSADAVSERGGTVSVDTYGAFTYTPPFGAWGPDRFGYVIADMAGGTADAEALVNITPTVIPLATIAAGEGGFVAEGDASTQAGTSAAGVGDVNGDGLEDVLVSQSLCDNGLGCVDVVFGKTDLDSVALADVRAGTGGFVVEGHVVQPGQQYGVYNVASAGDVDGDGLGDMLLNATGYAEDGAITVRAYVVFGKSGDTDPILLADVYEGTGGFIVYTSAEPPMFNSSDVPMATSAAGDVNGDGLGDIVVGIGSHPDTHLSQAWVVFGKIDGAAVDLDALGDDGAGFALEGEAVARYDGWVSGAGDVDGDGLDDVIVGNADAAVDGQVSAGRSYVVLGKTDSDPIALASLSEGEGFVIAGGGGDLAGWRVGAAGDFDGDGFDDVVVYAEGLFSDYLIRGASDTSTILLEDLQESGRGFAMTNVLAGNELPSTTALAGGRDVDGDGLDDIVLGCGYSPTSSGSWGRTYVLRGNTDLEPIDLPSLVDGERGFAIESEAESQGTQLPVGVSDINGDGLTDIVLADFFAGDAQYSGRVYVVHGTSWAPNE